ncbi:Tethering factor for nuclear proteasome STS1 [Labeo rohita]|uniref:Tethering factor for nuclear proteasome STS1 n=1 Tax=Labeo rohita TaxID=84645 RepID=A0ABQ8L371_LABRO|nr:Tethering factor for nuclear proteasome STS1 [Labeo rohita]
MQACQAELDLQLEVRRLEIEADKEVQLRWFELEAAKVAASSAVQPSPASAPQGSPPSDASSLAFDVSRHIALVPQFREAEIDSYFGAFERIATALQWPKEVADFSSLRGLLLLEEFKSCLPERVVTYLNEQKVSSVSQAAVLADEFVLTHKNVFVSARTEKHSTALPSQIQSSRPKPST